MTRQPINVDSVEQKPRGQACFRCKQKKIKCDGSVPKCSTCTRKNVECHYQRVQRKRGKGKSKKCLEELRERLARIESLLSPGTELQDERRQLNQPKPQFRSLIPVHDVPTSQNENFPHRDQQSAKVALDSSSTKALLDEASSNTFETLGYFWEQVSHRVRTHDPSDTFSLQEPEVIFLLLSIDDICSDLPIFDAPSFKTRLRNQHTLQTCEDPAWWACINTLIAIAISRRMVNRSFDQMSAIIWTFFRNAYDVLSDVVAEAGDLLAVQALLAMAIFLRNTADDRTSSLLLSPACQALPMIELSAACQKASQDRDLYEKLFWVALILDTESNLGCSPNTLRLELVHINLPPSILVKDNGHLDLEGEHADNNIFHLRASLALIQSRIQHALYSTQSTKQTWAQMRTTVSALEYDLDQWLSTIPYEHRPQLNHASQNITAEIDGRIINLHFVYYHCVSLICWASRREDTSQDKDSGREAARSTIALLTTMPFPQILGGLWTNLCYTISAAFFLLSAPFEIEASDIKLLECLLAYLKELEGEEGCPLGNLQIACSAIIRITQDCGELITVSKLISTSTHPMYLAQRLMSNLPNRDKHITIDLAERLVLGWDGFGYGPFVPEVLKSDLKVFGR